MKKEIVEDNEGHYVRVTLDNGIVLMVHPDDADQLIAQIDQKDDR